MRRTRILSTIGPACDTLEGIRGLIEAGTDAFRLNFSHGTREGHAEVAKRVRSAASESGRPVAVLQDLSGPKIRIGAVNPPIDLHAGDRLVINLGDAPGVADLGDAPRGAGHVSCSFEALFASVTAGVRLLLDDGRIELEVTRASASSLETRVITGGLLESHKGINVPGVVLKTDAMTAKDEADLAAGVAMGVDLVAVSFVQSADDMRRVRAAAARFGAPSLPLIAKIEKPRAVDELEAILDVSDGLMVARGDLGIEMPLEMIPAVQRQIVQAARRRGAPVIVATQVLESMRSAPRPTRAEVTDAAHVVDEGADAVMLAGETAIGQYPQLAVSTLDRILREAEKVRTMDAVPMAASGGHDRALGQAAVALASGVNANAIVALTEGGRTAMVLAALRPDARILAVTASIQTAARLALVWGVTPLVADTTRIADVRSLLRAQGLVPAGGVVVFVSTGSALSGSDRNFVHVETL